jgi:hypothetical protein
MIPAGLDFTLARGKIPSQREALKNVRGSNEGFKTGEDLPFGPAAHQGFSKEESGNAACVAPAAQQVASRTGAKENR